MRIFGLRIKTWIFHPILSWEAFKRRNMPVVDLDNPENNCSYCGCDHHYAERLSQSDKEIV